MANYVYENGELRHHGVLGMKWGVRRFQNKDGSRTPIGKKRYSDDNDAETKTKKLKSTKAEKHSIKDMSDTELQQKIRRLEMEKRYSDLSKETTNKGREFVKKYAAEAGKKIILDTATDITAQVAKHFMAKGVNQLIGDKDANGKILERVFANNKKKS